MKQSNRTKSVIGIFKAGFLLRGLLLVLAIGALSLSACGLFSDSQGSSESEGGDTGHVVAGIGNFDSADTAILMSKNTEKKTLTFWNRNVKKTYTLSYDGTTCFYDKYGESVSLGQIQPGDIVEVTFMRRKKSLTSMKLASDVFRLERVNYYQLDLVKGVLQVGQDTKMLKITDNTHYFSGEDEIEPMDLNPEDVLSFSGIDNEVLSVKVERGHGYLRLLGNEKFIGGWIEIGQSQIRRITEDMLLPVAEGSYNVLISKGGNSGERPVVIRRNEETVLDISDMEAADAQQGTVLFSLKPSGASIYVDGEKVQANLPVTLEYGLHQLMVKADGYQTLTQYIRVGQPSAGIDIALDPVGAGSQDQPTESDIITAYYKVHLDAPAGAEVYLDGTYIGVIPCSFKKEAGSHVVSLRKSGYITRSYTLPINSEQKDISYSFADLEPKSGDNEDKEDESNVVKDILNTLLK